MTMEVQEDFVAEVEAMPVVVSNVDDRIYPLLIDADTQLPAMSYTFRDGIAASFYVGSYGLATYDIDIVLHTRDYMTSVQISDAFVDKFNGTTLELNSNTLAQQSIVGNVIHAPDTDDPGVFRSVITINLTI